MRIVLDGNVPEDLASDFVGHDCGHVVALGLSGIKNGKLLDLLEEAGFQVLLTFDKGMPNQQRLVGRRIAIFVLKPDGQGLRAVQALVSEVLLALLDVQEAEVRVFTNRFKR